MTAEELYQVYVRAMADLNCAVDPWEWLDPIEKEAWVAVAEAAHGATD
jgi:hypothetical protein